MSRRLAIPLRVLPPRSTKFNGCVERANRSARAKFWNRHDGTLTVAGTAPALSKHEFFHNYKRPRQALDHQTPDEHRLRLSRHRRHHPKIQGR